MLRPKSERLILQARISSTSFRRRSVNLDLNIIIQVVARVAVAVTPNVAAHHTLGVDKLALGGLDIIPVLAGAEAHGVVCVIVENRLDIFDEIRVPGNLHNHILINAGLLVIMPDNNSVDIV